ncbi:hypothetical protein GYMLUDRAFT_132616, partial [Collybiopsis luxurians FD-317 M1]
LFSLDVDNNIWLDIGLGYDKEKDGLPPLWLANDSVCRGICALLDRNHCNEEQRQLLAEHNAMQEWFTEEWRVL